MFCARVHGKILYQLLHNFHPNLSKLCYKGHMFNTQRSMYFPKGNLPPRHRIVNPFQNDEEKEKVVINEEEKDPVEEGHNEAVIEVVKKEDELKNKFEKIVSKSERVLFTTSTIFPFHFFPNKLIIDQNKVSVVEKNFFWSETIRSVMIKNILDITIDTAPLFAHLVIIDVGFKEDAIRLNYLRKKDALLARKIIQGLIVAIKEGIDLSDISGEQLIQKLEGLGQVHAEVVDSTE